MALVSRVLRLGLAVAAVIAPLAVKCPANAADATDFYRGRTIQMIVGFNPGGGADSYARVIARHMGRHIQGDPVVIVRNMQGAGSLNAANYVYNRSPMDGTELGLFAGHIATDPLITQATYKYDARKFNWIGSPASQPNVCIASPESGVQTLSDTLRREMILGTTGTAGNSTFDFPTLLSNLLGTKLKLVKGYAGSGALKLAMERGEIEGFCGVGYDFLRGAGLADGHSRILVQFGLSKSAHMPQVPFIMDLAKSDEQRQIFRMIFGWLNFERALAAPPGVPVERIAALRRAFDATTRDPEFLADAERAKVEIDAMSGAEITSFVEEAYKTPSETASKAARFLGRDAPVDRPDGR